MPRLHRPPCLQGPVHTSRKKQSYEVAGTRTRRSLLPVTRDVFEDMAAFDDPVKTHPIICFEAQGHLHTLLGVQRLPLRANSNEEALAHGLLWEDADSPGHGYNDVLLRNHPGDLLPGDSS